MLENKDKLESYSQLLNNKKEYYHKYINELETMLKKINENEKELFDQKNNINKKDIDQGIKGLHNDIQDSHTLYSINEKISKVYSLKKELSDDILKTRNEQENMLNQIIKNFNTLMQIIE